MGIGERRRDVWASVGIQGESAGVPALCPGHPAAVCPGQLMALVQRVSPGSAGYSTVGEPCETTGWFPCLL